MRCDEHGYIEPHVVYFQIKASEKLKRVNGDYHLAEVRGTLDGFGVADPSVFDAKLQKAG